MHQLTSALVPSPRISINVIRVIRLTDRSSPPTKARHARARRPFYGLSCDYSPAIESVASGGRDEVRYRAAAERARHRHARAARFTPGISHTVVPEKRLSP